MAEPAPILTPELLRSRTSYAPEDCAPRRVQPAKVAAYVCSVWGLSKENGRGWQHLVPGQAIAEPERREDMAAAWELLQKFTAKTLDLGAPVRAWAALYALFDTDDLRRLHLQSCGLLPALEASLRACRLHFEQRGAHVLTSGHDVLRRSDDIRRAIARATPADRAAALDLAARAREGAGINERITLGWYFPEVYGDDAARAWFEEPNWDMDTLYACVQDPDLAYRLVRERKGWRTYADLVARFPDRAHGWMLEVAATATNNFDHHHAARALAAYATPEVAALFASRLSRQEYRAAGIDWLLTRPDLARPALSAVVAAKGRPAKPAAEILARLGHAAEIPAEEAPPEDWPEILRPPVPEISPKTGKPMKMAKLAKLSPAWKPATFTRLRLRDGRPLPDAAMDAFARWLSGTELEKPSAGLAELRRELDPASLTALARDLLRAHQMNSRQRNGWFLHALRWFADDALIAHVATLDFDEISSISEILSHQGSPAAVRALLCHRGIHGRWASAVSVDFLSTAMMDALRRCAKIQKLSAIEEVIEAAVPLADAAPDGTAAFDYGGRHLRVGFDAYLLPRLLDEDGALREHLPPRRPDQDPASAEAARLRWSRQKEEVASLAPLLLKILEDDMLRQRPRPLDWFRRRWIGHPLLCALAQRIVWCAEIQAEGQPSTLAAFRVTEDRSLADSHDAPFTLPEGAQILVAHPALLPADEVDRWIQILSDYAVLQPFPQIGRPHARLPAPPSRPIPPPPLAALTAPQIGRPHARLPAFHPRLIPILPTPLAALTERIRAGGWQQGFEDESRPSTLSTTKFRYGRQGMIEQIWGWRACEAELIGDPVTAISLSHPHTAPTPVLISEALSAFPLRSPSPLPPAQEP